MEVWVSTIIGVRGTTCMIYINLWWWLSIAWIIINYVIKRHIYFKRHKLWLTMSEQAKAVESMQLRSLGIPPSDLASSGVIGKHWPSHLKATFPGVILCMCPANERWRYNVTSSLIGCARTKNDPCIPRDFSFKMTGDRKHALNLTFTTWTCLLYVSKS